SQTAPSVALTSAGITTAAWLDGGKGTPAGLFGQHSTFTIPTSPVVQGTFASAGGDGVTELGYGLTLAPANNRLVLVYGGSNGPAPRSVTFNGASCSLVGQAINDMALPGTNETGCYGYLFHIKNASLPGPGTYNVAVNFGFPTNAASIASMISNADQTTPFGPVSANLNGPPATSISTSVTACVPSLLIDMVIQDWEGTPGWESTRPQNQLRHDG